MNNNNPQRILCILILSCTLFTKCTISVGGPDMPHELPVAPLQLASARRGRRLVRPPQHRQVRPVLPRRRANPLPARPACFGQRFGRSPARRLLHHHRGRSRVRLGAVAVHGQGERAGGGDLVGAGGSDGGQSIRAGTDAAGGGGEELVEDGGGKAGGQAVQAGQRERH